MAIINDGLKPILTTSGFGLNIQSSTSSLNGNELLYTYADVDDTTKPYGNLFKSFNFPIGNDEINPFNASYGSTALRHLNTTKIIVVEIPKGKYGELIDGKTFQLKIPVVLSGVASSTTLYGTYFGFSGTSTTYLPNLNTKLSEQNSYASQFGLTPSTGNNFNSNVTFLYSNDIQRPKNPIPAQTSVIFQSSITLTSNTSIRLQLTGVTFNPGDIISVSVSMQNNTTLPTTIKFTIGGEIISINTGLVFQTVGGTVAGLNPFIYDDVSNPSINPITIIITKQNSTYLSWNAYSLINKFPNNSTSPNGKRYARYNGTDQDRPVGILYNDKGIAVITEPTLVSGFRYSAGTSSGYNDIASGSSYNLNDTNFAKIYFTDSSISQSTFDSITSEFVQNITCIAGLNEFTGTTNSTYAGSYGDNATEKPFFITTIGLYNAAYELIGIGKLSEPVKKTESNIIPFNIKLVI